MRLTGAVLNLEFDGSTYNFRFTIQSEVRAVRSAYLEHIANAAERFDDYDISELATARVPESANKHTLSTQKPLDVIGILEVFAHNTREAISDIPRISGIPKYKNKDIVERFDLGKSAERMAHEAREQIERIHMQEAAKATESILESLEDELAKWPSQLDDQSSDS